MKMMIMKLSVLLALTSTSSVDARIRGQTPNSNKETRKLTQSTQSTQLVGYGGEPHASHFPLQLCEGDCDNDSECDVGLVCFKRDKGDPVPGCDDGERFMADTDFCVPAPIEGGLETWSPTFAPTFADTANAVLPPTGLPPLTFVEDPSWPLGLCQGDCDTDADCLDEFICFERDLQEPVPGCSGDGLESVDYCTRPVGGEVTITMPPISTPQEAAEGVLYLETVGDDVTGPLGLCQGDCDTDDDCLDFFVCYQRDGLEVVPGCMGDGETSYDYCIMDPDGTRAPTTVNNGVTSSPAMAASGSAVYLFEIHVASTAVTQPLGLCRGDCDTDDDCLDDLVCFQRDEMEPVPGCSGLGQTSYDYCIMLPNATKAPTTVNIGATMAPAMASANLTVLIFVADGGTQPLGLCQGDCDTDDDCLDDLVCYQRDGLEAVLGCSGEGDMSYDYCIMHPDATKAPTTVSTGATLAPVSSTISVTVIYLEFVSNDGTQPLGLCQGDCDTDDDCLDDLVCYQRDGLEAVLGCTDEGITSFDYCVMDPAGTKAPTSPVVSMAPAATPVPLTELEFVSNDGTVPLGLCQGDCDTDADCLDLLICFQRNMLEPVPGCSGQGDMSYDYCIVDPDGGNTGEEVCNFDAEECPDGSSVGRDPENSCEFFPCPEPAAACTQDLQECSDGSSVGRDPQNDCAFFSCPEPAGCTQEVRECSDGSSVGRDPDSGCAFFPCSGPACTDETQQCADESFVARDPDNGCAFFPCPTPVICTEDAFQCPDGSFVSREAPNCAFAACPETAVTAAPVTAMPVTAMPVTAMPVTAMPVTAMPVTAETATPVTAMPVTAMPVTAAPVTAMPVTATPVTAMPVTAMPVTATPATAMPVTMRPLTEPPVEVVVVVVAAEESPVQEPVQEPASQPMLSIADSKDSLEDKSDKSDKYNDEDYGLALCEGSCYYNDDCASGLVCFSAGSFGTIPGCDGTPLVDYSYCTNP